jgi:hypothetical protein
MKIKLTTGLFYAIAGAYYLRFVIRLALIKPLQVDVLVLGSRLGSLCGVAKNVGLHAVERA